MVNSTIFDRQNLCAKKKAAAFTLERAMHFGSETFFKYHWHHCPFKSSLLSKQYQCLELLLSSKYTRLPSRLEFRNATI